MKTGVKEENAVFVRIDCSPIPPPHAEAGIRQKSEVRSQEVRRKERSSFRPFRPPMIEKAYLHIGPKFGTVSNGQTEAIKACRDKRDGMTGCRSSACLRERHHGIAAASAISRSASSA